MELHKLSVGDLKGLDKAAFQTTEKDIRKELLKLRMDIYTAKSAHGAKIRGLRKSLARLLTVKGQKEAEGRPATKANTKASLKK